MVMAPGLCGEWKCNHSLSEGYYPDLTGFSWPFGRRLGNDNGQLCRVREMGALHFHVWRSRNGRAIKEGDGSLPHFGAVSVHLPAHLGWNKTSTAKENVSSGDLKKCDGVLSLKSRED